MSALAGYPQGSRSGWRQGLPILLGGAAVAGLGAATAAGMGFLAAAGIIGIASLTLGLVNWRASILGLMLFMPFSGLLPLAMFPNTAPGVLAKDLAFTLPAYAGVIVAAGTGRRDVRIPSVPWLLLFALSGIVLVQAFNPQLEVPLVGLIGAKVWLFYLPLVVLGYNLVSSKAQLQRWLPIIAWLSVIPSAVTILSAALIYNGLDGIVYGWYGEAAEAATQDFTAFDVGGGELRRIPGVFTSTSQNWLYLTASVCVVYAAWRINRRSTSGIVRFLPLLLGVVALASLVSGARAAFIVTPAVLIGMAALDGINVKRLLLTLGLALFAMLAALQVLQIGAGPLAELTGGHALFILDFFRDTFRDSMSQTVFGIGAGVDTNAARYAFGTDDYGVVYAQIGGLWYESWYVKALLELGWPGLLILVALSVAVIRTLIRAHRATRALDPELGSVTAATLVMTLWIFLYAVKTAYTEYDPMSVYIWLFLGVAVACPALARAEARRRGSRKPPTPSPDRPRDAGRG
jgi:hypothetical protein